MNTNSQPRPSPGERDGGGVSPPSPAAPSQQPLPYSLARFLDTLAIADDLAKWKPSHEGEEPPW